ncbi:hypothetical protein [Nonomuraea dietziae]|uniref:hypothetical protein n=1 Tax=Nonomuraea dietziae TaxID=65515 RepID=UPI0031DADCB1
MRSTVVTFPEGQVNGRSEIVGSVPLGVRHGLVTAETPFHPLDHTWPDQPADRGTIGGLTVVDCVTGARSAEGEILLGQDIPVRRGDEGWDWLVVHVTDAPLETGATVELAVDEAYRQSLSAPGTPAATWRRWRSTPRWPTAGARRSGPTPSAIPTSTRAPSPAPASRPTRVSTSTGSASRCARRASPLRASTSATSRDGSTMCSRRGSRPTRRCGSTCQGPS